MQEQKSGNEQLLKRNGQAKNSSMGNDKNSVNQLGKGFRESTFE